MEALGGRWQSTWWRRMPRWEGSQLLVAELERGLLEKSEIQGLVNKAAR